MKKDEQFKNWQWLRWLFLPFALMYGLITGIRNYFYKREVIKSVSFDRFIINIGNLNMGGTGKSPMITYLAEKLAQKVPVAILSRGYRRQSTGFRLAGENDNANTLGDEPFQFYRKFVGTKVNKNNDNVPGVVVAVGEERVLAVPEILAEYDDREIILLDDAYQHRAIRPDMNILMTTYQNPFYKDYLFPVGWLRETRRGSKRAHAVIVSHCPGQIALQEKQTIKASIREFAMEDVPVFFTSLVYARPQPLWEEQKAWPGNGIIIVTGIANSRPFEEFLTKNYNVLHHFKFPDHHKFLKSDMDTIKKFREKNDSPVIFTTEKDAARMVKSDLKDHWQEIPVYYVPVQPFFLEKEEEFLGLVEKLHSKKQQQD